ncbi:MAG: DUF4139 domain-containing protein [Pseudomonadota bacterium]
MRSFIYAAAIASSAISAVQAETLITPETRDALAITIYNDGLALVRDSRFVNVKASRGTLAFEGVSTKIMPQTAALSGNMYVVEQNFDFDLLSPQALLNKAVGQEVLLYRTEDDGDLEVRDAVVLANNGGAAVLKVGNQIEVIQNDFPGRIVFKNIPPNLRAEPTLSMQYADAKPGDQKIELAYLTKGIGWSADYVGDLSADEKTLDLTGLITLTNKTGVAYVDAKTQLIAGDVNRVRVQKRQRSNLAMQFAASSRAENVKPEAVGEYHMYTLPQPTTIADKQTKQVTFMSVNAVPVTKTYAYYSTFFRTQNDPQNVSVSLEFDNNKANNLGMPLPKGVVRIYGMDQSGSAQFIGEDAISHTSEGNAIDLTMGKAFDVTVQSKKAADALVSKTRIREIRDITMEYTVKNAKDTAVSVELKQYVGENAELRDTSIEAEEIDAQTLMFSIPVEAKGETKLRFKVRVG